MYSNKGSLIWAAGFPFHLGKNAMGCWDAEIINKPRMEAICVPTLLASSKAEDTLMERICLQLID